MSQTPPTPSSSNFPTIFCASIKAYEKKTKKDLLGHPLMAQLQACNSPTDILAALHALGQLLEKSTRGDDKLTNWLDPTIKVLCAFSEALGTNVGLKFCPAKVIFAGAGVLLLAAKDVVASQDALIDIFECIANFFRRLESYTTVQTTASMKDIILKIMIEVLEIFGLVTKEMKRGRAKKYFMKLFGRRDIEDALRRLDRLTQEEARMATAQVLKGANQAIEGDNVVKATTMETKVLAQPTANNMGEDSPFPSPIRPQVFFGRNDELKTIIDLIFSSASAARIAILGPGGVGKTILAHAVLTHEKVASHFCDSRYLIPCESLTSRDALLVALAKSLSLLQPGMTVDSYSVGLEPRVLSALGSEECILCLDSFESPWDQPGGSRRAVEVLLANITAQSSVTVLITMRGVERPKGTAWTLPRLPPLTNFPRDAAMRTWENLAGTCDEWAEQLIDAVDCLPLAVTILGSLAEVSTAETLWERWQKENIALVEKVKGDKLASLGFSIALSLESNRMAADCSSKRVLGILSLLPEGMPALPSPEFRRLFPDIPDISRSLNTLLECSLAIHTTDKRVQVNSLLRLYCERNDIASLEDRQALSDYHLTLASQGYDNPNHEPSEIMLSEITPSPLGPHHHSQSLTLPSGASPTSPLTVTRGRRHSFSVHKPWPVRDAAANAAQPTITITPVALQSTTGASAHLPPISLGSSAAPATSAPALLPIASCTASSSRSHSPARSPENGSGNESDSDGAIMSASIWWNHSRRKPTIPIEQMEGYIHTRSRAIDAISGALDTAASIGHEALSTGIDLLQFAPVPGLELAANILLNIWDAVGMVKTNRVASLRLTKRCEEILISIRDEIADTGDTVAEELRAPIVKLVKAFRGVHDLLNKLGQRPFLKRYLGRNEIQSSILACDTSLSDALGMFRLSIQIRTLNLIQANELRRQKETRDPLELPSHLSPGLPPVHLPPAVLQSSPADSESVQKSLHSMRAAQNAQDRARDAADLRQLMRTALAANDDFAMFEVLQIAHSEMPEAIKTLERALERVVVQLDTEESTTTLPSPQVEEAGKANSPSVDPSDTGASQCGPDTLDREFIQTGINALRRLSKGTDLGLPSWTITRYEIDLEAKIGVGFFSYVYRGTWRKHTVAIKVLAETTPRKIFLREVEIWKSLYHPNVLELFGASSATGDPPWFLVSKYYPRGSLVKHLKGLSDDDAARVDALKMIHEISEGMAYLHKQGVLHGDLKAANILVDNDTRCVISDFGQSEMKSEVYRITRASQPRGTLRWQAPELMQGTQTLTPEIDVYAFAICCGEILTMGDLPWPFMDDDAVRHLVLNENKRPSLPPSNLVDVQLINVISASWDYVPSNRPSFEQIAREVKRQRTEWSTQNTNSQTFGEQKPIPPAVGWDAQNAQPSHRSPLPISQDKPDDAVPQHPPTAHGNNLNATKHAPYTSSGSSNEATQSENDFSAPSASPDDLQEDSMSSDFAEEELGSSEVDFENTPAHAKGKGKAKTTSPARSESDDEYEDDGRANDAAAARGPGWFIHSPVQNTTTKADPSFSIPPLSSPKRVAPPPTSPQRLSTHAPELFSARVKPGANNPALPPVLSVEELRKAISDASLRTHGTSKKLVAPTPAALKGAQHAYPPQPKFNPPLKETYMEPPAPTPAAQKDAQYEYPPQPKFRPQLKVPATFAAAPTSTSALSQTPSQSTQLFVTMLITICHPPTKMEYPFKVKSTHLVGRVLTTACSAFGLSPTGATLMALTEKNGIVTTLRCPNDVSMASVATDGAIFIVELPK